MEVTFNRTYDLRWRYHMNTILHRPAVPLAPPYEKISMTFLKSSLAASLVAISALTSVGAHAQDAKPAAAAAAPAAPTAAATKPEAWVGLAATSSDGAMLGKVTSLKAAADGKGQLLYVTSPTDGKIFAIPSELATAGPNGLQIKATAAELGKAAK
jgi:hypothetical protein